MAKHFKEREYECEANRICDINTILHKRQQTLLKCVSKICGFTSWNRKEILLK